MKELVWLTFAFLVVFGQQARAEQYSRTVTAEWQAPEHREDGTPLLSSEIAGYDIEYRAGDTIESIRDDGSATSHDRAVLTSGAHCAIIRTVDTGGLVSDWSEPACIDIRAAPARIMIRFVEAGDGSRDAERN